MLIFLRAGLLCLLFVSSLVDAASGSAVFGSFKDRSLALKESAQISRRFGIDARIEEAVVNGITYHRILGPLMEPSAARALVGKVKASGFSDVWVLSDGPDSFAIRAPLVRPPIEKSLVKKRVGLEETAKVAGDSRVTQVLSEAPKTRAVSENGSVSIPTPIMRIPRIDDAIIEVDGRVDEPIWSEVTWFDNMIVTDPDTFEDPSHVTKTRILYTEKGLYVSGEMMQPPNTLVERLSSRDEFINRDELGIAIDSSGEGLYGYFFRLALGGSKIDGKISPERNLTNQWDGPWVGETAVTDDGWSAEMFIPWSALSMPDGSVDRRIAISIFRKVAYMDEMYTWPSLPFSQARFISAFAPASVEGVDPKQQWEAYPYVSATADEIRSEADGRAGVDLAWRPSSNLQLTATVNPDFGSVESDDVVVNLTAYEIFFPEKRLFFLEGNEVFVTSSRSNPRGPGGQNGSGGRQSPGMYRMEPTTLLNTRRIGGSAKQVVIPEGVTVSGVEQSKPSELVGAVKMVGQSGGLRYGILSAFEKEAELFGTDDATGLEVPITADGRDFGVARVLYEAASAGGRKSVGYMGTLASNPLDDALVHGIDTHWLSKNGRVAWDMQLLSSDVDGEMGYGLFTDLSWTPRRGVGHNFSLDILDDDLDISDLGFLRRNDLIGMKYRFFRSTSQGLPDRLRNRRIGIYSQIYQNTDGRLTESYLGIMGTWLTKNNLELAANVNFKPQHYDDRNSRGNGTYRKETGFYSAISLGTSSAKKLAFSAMLQGRAEDLGDVTYVTTLGFTYTPVDRFSVDLDVVLNKRNEWVLYGGDREFTSYDAFEVQPNLSMDFFISSKQQLRLKLQWVGIDANQSHFWSIPEGIGELVPRFKDLSDSADDFTVSRLTAQLRYRWEIGPLSDLFLVYTRGSNLPSQIDDDFMPLFRDAVDEPIIDVFTMKLRYRFGS